MRWRALPSCWLSVWKKRRPGGQRRGVSISPSKKKASPQWSSQPSEVLIATPQCPGRVPGQRDHRDLGVEAGDQADALEAEPVLAARPVLDPVRVLAPLLAHVAAALRRADGGLGRRELGREEVDLGVREVPDAAGVVDVEVGGDDVADVLGIVTQRLDLANGCLVLDRRRADQITEGLAEPLRIGESPSPNPVSTRTSSPPASISRQWATIFVLAQATVAGEQARPPIGHIVPQLRCRTSMHPRLFDGLRRRPLEPELEGRGGLVDVPDPARTRPPGDIP